MSDRLSDHDLTELVECAASGAINSAAGHRGTPDWAALDAGAKNRVREAALPFIFHGTKALAGLGYRKPRTITTPEELDALPENTVIRDAEPATMQFMGGKWWSVGSSLAWDADTIDFPAVVLYEPEPGQ
jgi:hypothetical protein